MNKRGSVEECEETERTEEKCLNYLRDQFGVEHLDFKLRVEGKNRKIYAFKECPLASDLRVKEGIYFGKIEKDGLRLSVEGSFLVGKHAKKGVIELSDEDAMKWLRGEDLESDVKGYVILKWRSYFLGCGKGNGKFIKNFVPKDRQLSSKQAEKEAENENNEKNERSSDV